MNNSKSPWSWVPSLYFAEGLPYVAVMTISIIMYKQLGLSNAEITFYTSWLYLPWMLKPLWSPFVDLVKTKRWWIITMPEDVKALGNTIDVAVGVNHKGRTVLSWRCATTPW